MDASQGQRDEYIDVAARQPPRTVGFRINQIFQLTGFTAMPAWMRNIASGTIGTWARTHENLMSASDDEENIRTFSEKETKFLYTQPFAVGWLARQLSVEDRVNLIKASDDGEKLAQELIKIGKRKRPDPRHEMY